MAALPSELVEIIKDSYREFCQENEIPLIELSLDKILLSERIAVIGFSGEKISGALSVGSTLKFLDISHPSKKMGMTVDSSDLADWLGEISNQLLGRIKNKLLQYGISINLATPTIVVGDRIGVNHSNRNRMMTYNSSGLGEPVTLVIEALIPDELNLKDKVETVEKQATEGDAFLF